MSKWGTIAAILLLVAMLVVVFTLSGCPPQQPVGMEEDTGVGGPGMTEEQALEQAERELQEEAEAAAREQGEELEELPEAPLENAPEMPEEAPAEAPAPE